MIVVPLVFNPAVHVFPAELSSLLLKV